MAVTSYVNMGDEVFGELTGGVRSNYVRDALGSVVAVTDTSNTKLYSARYKPSGGTLSSTGTPPRYTWCGVWGYDRAAGSAHVDFKVGARFYGTEEGRWSSADPLWPFEGAYTYAHARIVTRKDPSGLLGGHKPSGANVFHSSCSGIDQKIRQAAGQEVKLFCDALADDSKWGAILKCLSDQGLADIGKRDCFQKLCGMDNLVRCDYGGDGKCVARETEFDCKTKCGTQKIRMSGDCGFSSCGEPPRIDLCTNQWVDFPKLCPESPIPCGSTKSPFPGTPARTIIHEMMHTCDNCKSRGGLKHEDQFNNAADCIRKAVGRYK